MKCVRVAIVAVEKQKYCKFWLSVLALVLQTANRTSHEPWYNVIRALFGFSIFFNVISYKARFSGWKKKVTERKMCVLKYNHRSKLFFFLRIKYPFFLSDYINTRIFSKYFRKILKNQISWKSIEWETSCPMRIDRHTLRSCRLSQIRART
jgi:hypothetical protein